MEWLFTLRARLHETLRELKSQNALENRFVYITISLEISNHFQNLFRWHGDFTAATFQF